MSERTTLTGMVLKSAPSGEYDRRIVLLTRERGKVTAFVRGARRPKSSLQAATGLFAFGSFEAYEGKSAWTVVKAEIREHFLDIAKDYDLTVYGSYFLEAAEYFSAEGDEASDQLNLLYVTLRALLKGQMELPLIRRIYELRTLYYNGTYPEVFSCIQCGKKDNLERFDFYSHGLFCAECGKDRKGIRLERASVYALQYILSAPLEKLYSFRVNEKVFGQIDQMIDRIFQSYVDRPFNSAAFLS